MWSLPKEMYAEISRWLPDDYAGALMRKLARDVIIRDDRDNWTYGNGIVHSFNDEPSAFISNTKYWHKNGRRHRDNDLPAIIRANGDKHWFINGKYHRDNDRPAIVYANGDQYWYQHDKLHRENDKPAVICANGDQYWYINNLQHRTNDLPAVICANGRSYWYRHGVLYK